MWIGHQSGPAGEPPTPEQVQRWQKRISAPDNEFPAAVGLTVVLGQTNDAAVGIVQIAAFTTGFQFTLAVRVRRPRPDLPPGGLLMLVSGHAHPGVEVPLADRLLLGIEYPDGDRASTLQDMRMLGPDAESDEQQLMLVQHGASGGENSVDQTYWVTPLPSNGPVSFIVAWPSFGIAESRTVLDGATIRAAAEHSRLLWPPQPAVPPAEPPSLPRPSTGWFAEPPG